MRYRPGEPNFEVIGFTISHAPIACDDPALEKYIRYVESTARLYDWFGAFRVQKWILEHAIRQLRQYLYPQPEWPLVQQAVDLNLKAQMGEFYTPPKYCERRVGLLKRWSLAEWKRAAPPSYRPSGE